MYNDEKITHNAFRKGLREADAIPGRIGTIVRLEIRKRLGNISEQALYYRANGNVEHTEFEREGIEKVFRGFCQITDPWGL